MHEHSVTFGYDGLALDNDVRRALRPRPEFVEHVSFGVIHIWAVVAVSSLGTFADLKAWYGGRSGNLEANLKVVSRRGDNDVGVFRGLGGRLKLDGEAVRLATPPVLRPGNRRNESRNIRGSPNILPSLGVIDPTCELNSRIP